MTVTASSAGNQSVRGTYTASFTSTDTYLNVRINDFVSEDISAYPYVPGPGRACLSRTRWFANIEVAGISPQVSRLKSALPKYTLGEYCYSWQGVQTGDGFLNYQSQCLPNGIFFLEQSSPIYPSLPLAPEYINNAHFEFLSNDFTPGAPLRADCLYLQFNPGAIGSYRVQIWYDVYRDVVDIPASYGFL